MLKLRRYFDTTGGCDLLFSQTSKHEGLTFTGNRTTQVGRRRTRCRGTAPECRRGEQATRANCACPPMSSVEPMVSKCCN